MTTQKKRLKVCETFNAEMETLDLPYRLISYSDGTFGIESKFQKDQTIYDIEIEDADMAARVAQAWVDGVFRMETVVRVVEQHEQHEEAVRNAVLQRVREKEAGRKPN